MGCTHGRVGQTAGLCRGKPRNRAYGGFCSRAMMKMWLTGRQMLWSAWVVGALLLLAVGQPMAYGLVVPLTALVLALIPGTLPKRTRSRSVDRRDLLVIGGLYLAVVGLYWLAFRFFTVDSVLGLFLCFDGLVACLSIFEDQACGREYC